jgi:hypothetical protein
MSTNRRDFLKSTGAAALFVNAPSDLITSAANAKPQVAGSWDFGSVKHILPTVSDSEILIKLSLDSQKNPPVLKVGSHTVIGKMTDTKGEFWQFFIKNLKSLNYHQNM